MRRLTVLHRLAAVISFAGLIVLAGCKEPAGTNAQVFVSGSQDVVVNSCEQYNDTSDANSMYYVCKFVWTNSGGPDMIPELDKFVFIDRDENRSPGIESGAAALIGITNYQGVVKKGASQQYTLGFHVQLNAVGSIYYDQT
ncbi:MAG TPA: hypothetical protein VME66_08930 [Candidatus Acidoferrales bacterium]|nr:hypothetical protein [Candidatus Acidoferrales bacterium]